jgi:hypothetical protein
MNRHCRVAATLAVPVLVFAAAAGCAKRESALMRPAPMLDTTPPSGSALVVFVRDSTACDSGDPFRIVDEQRRFLGESTPSSKFTARVEAGRHAFFVWEPHGVLPHDQFPEANQVGAVGADFEAGKTYTVDVSIQRDNLARMRNTCSEYHNLALRLVDPRSADVADELEKAQPYAPDLSAGQVAVNQDDANVTTYIALGWRKLGR